MQCFTRSILVGCLLCMVSMSTNAEPFTPGNIVLTDATEDRLIEVNLTPDEAQVVQIITWPLGDTSRRRPLGMAIDPLGNTYVGITGVPVSATEQVDFPEGRGEVLRIAQDGTMDFYILPPEVTKGTWMSSDNPNEVFLMNNEPPPPFPSQSYRLRYSGNQVIDTTLFNVTMTAQGNGNGGNGKALVLPDGRILIPSSTDNFINVYDEDGGDPVDQIPTTRPYRSLAYIAGTDYLLANPTNGTSVDRIGFDGSVEGTFDFSVDGLGGVWNFTILNDGTERFIATNHNGSAASKSAIYIYDASDLEAIFPEILPLTGLQDFGDTDGIASSLFDSAVVPEPVAKLNEWMTY